MSAKINHVAIVSEKYSLLAAFYQSLFGMTTSPKGRTNRAITVGDGYVGLNMNPLRDGCHQISLTPPGAACGGSETGPG